MNKLFLLLILTASVIAADKSVPQFKTVKYGAPIDLQLQLSETPKVGVPLQIKVNWATQADGNWSLSTRSDEDLALRREVNFDNQNIMQLQKRSAEANVIEIVPQREGTYFVSVTARYEHNGKVLTRTQAIPIMVGDKNANGRWDLPGKLVKDSDGNDVLEIPAK